MTTFDAPSLPAAATASAPPRVLVVDDDARNRRLLEAMLAPEGYEIVHASSGEEALARIARDPELALVLLDLAMPGLGGIETCRKVRKELGLVDLPIVFVTAHGERSERIRAKDCGADDFLLKPVDETELVARVRNLVERKAYRDERERRRQQLEAELELRTQQLLHADRLILLGTLAGAVGHELNNVARVLTSSLELVAESARKGAPADGEDLQTMKAATGHLQAHARQLLTLARPGPDRLERLDLRGVVDEAVQFLRAASRLRGVRVETDLPPVPLWAWVNRIRLEQVLLNLVGNAIDAVHGEREPRRRVRVRLQVLDFTEERGPAVSCEVTDTGPGMSAEVEAQIFTPYFTTKGPERGTGLGLVVVRQIVESYGGTVSCRSVLGQGTTFTFDLPLQQVPPLPGQV